MIDFIELFNIQNHKHSRIDFNKGLTCITGETDSGKTAFLQGFQSVVEGEPMEIHYNESEGRIIIGKNGKTVERVRIEEMERKKCPNCKTTIEGMQQFCDCCGERLKRKKIDDYYIVDGKRTKDTGSEVPDEVLQFFNMDKISLGNEKVSLNIFPKKNVKSFVDIDSSQRMEVLGSVGKNLVSLENKSIKINNEIKDIQDNIKGSLKNQNYLQKQLEKYKLLDVIEPLVEEYEKYKLELSNLKNHIDLLSDFIPKYERQKKITNIYKLSNEVKLMEKIPFEEIYNLIKRSEKNKVKLKIYSIANNMIVFDTQNIDFTTLYKLIDDLHHVHQKITIYNQCVGLSLFSNYDIEQLIILIGKLEALTKLPKITFPESFTIGNLKEVYELYQKIEATRKKMDIFNHDILQLTTMNEIQSILDLIDNINTQKSLKNEILDEIFELEEQIEEDKKFLKNIEICPLCKKGGFHECI